MTTVDVVDAEADAGLVAAVYDTILRPSFTPAELPDATGLTQGLDRSGAMVLSAVVEDGVPVAAAVTEYTPEVDIDLLGYLAVRPGDRSRGLGAMLLDHLAERWRRRGVSLALAEVHDPRAWPETPDERSAARVRFYARWGSDVLDTPWVQPALQPGLDRVPHMLLAVLSRHPAGTDSVPTAALATWARSYYAFAEGPGALQPGDAQLEALMARLSDQPTLAVHPLAAYRRVAPLLVAPEA